MELENQQLARVPGTNIETPVYNLGFFRPPMSEEFKARGRRVLAALRAKHGLQGGAA